MKQLKLIRGLAKKAGRNHRGKITCYHKGNAKKINYRLIDFKRTVEDTHRVLTIEHDPNRNCFISKIFNQKQQTYSYFLTPENLHVFSEIITFSQPIHFNNASTLKIGTCTHLQNIPLGTYIHNVENYPGSGGVFARSAGTYAIILQKNIKQKYALIQLKSKETRLIPQICKATIGQISHSTYNMKTYRNYRNKFFNKAGRNRWKGIRPTVRGVAKNPVDHPHGGATSGGRPSCTPWGKPTKGHPTRNIFRTKKYILVSRRQLKLKNLL